MKFKITSECDSSLVIQSNSHLVNWKGRRIKKVQLMERTEQENLQLRLSESNIEDLEYIISKTDEPEQEITAYASGLLDEILSLYCEYARKGQLKE